MGCVALVKLAALTISVWPMARRLRAQIRVLLLLRWHAHWARTGLVEFSSYLWIQLFVRSLRAANQVIRSTAPHNVMTRRRWQDCVERRAGSSNAAQQKQEERAQRSSGIYVALPVAGPPFLDLVTAPPCPSYH